MMQIHGEVRRRRAMSRRHDIVHVPPHILLRKWIPVRVRGAKQRVEQAVILDVSPPRVFLELAPSLLDDVVDADVLQNRVPLLELAHATDAEEVLQL